MKWVRCVKDVCISTYNIIKIYVFGSCPHFLAQSSLEFPEWWEWMSFVSWNEPLSDMPEFMLMRNSGWGEHERGDGDSFMMGPSHQKDQAYE